MLATVRNTLGGGKPKRARHSKKKVTKRKRVKVSLKIKGTPEQVKNAAAKLSGTENVQSGQF